MTDSSLKWALSWWFSMEPSLHHFLSHLTWILLLASCNPQAWCYCNSPSFHVPLLSLKRSHRQTNMTVNFIGDKLVSHFFHLRIHQTTVSFSLSLSLWHGVYLIPTCYVYVYIYVYIYLHHSTSISISLYIYNMYVYICMYYMHILRAYPIRSTMENSFRELEPWTLWMPQPASVYGEDNEDPATGGGGSCAGSIWYRRMLPSKFELPGIHIYYMYSWRIFHILLYVYWWV